MAKSLSPNLIVLVGMTSVIFQPETPPTQFRRIRSTRWGLLTEFFDWNNRNTISIQLGIMDRLD